MNIEEFTQGAYIASKQINTASSFTEEQIAEAAKEFGKIIQEAIFKQRFKLEPPKREDNFELKANMQFGMKVIGFNETEIIEIQVLKHKRKRTNKKWAKRKEFFLIKERPRMPALSVAAIA